MPTKIQIRRDTAADWTSNNPTLAAGEIGFESDTYKLKIGDGTTAWTSLAYGPTTAAGAITALNNATENELVTVGSTTTELDAESNLTYNGTTFTATAAVDLNGEVRFNKNYKEDIDTLTSSSTITVDCSLASVHKVTLATNTGFVISNLPTGGSVTLIITQDGTGSRTTTFGTDTSTAVKFPGGAPTLTTAGGSIDVVTIFNDGTNFLGNISQAFA